MCIARAVPDQREILPCVVVDDHIRVTVRPDFANVRVRIDAPDVRQIGRVDPEGGRRADHVVQRRLAAFLTPGGDRVRQSGALFGQAEMVIGHVLDHRVMPQLVGRFEERGDDAEDRGEDGETGQNERDPDSFVMNTVGQGHY